MNVKRILTKTRRARLEKLAAKLESLPRGYNHFDMGTYYRSSGGHSVQTYAQTGDLDHCGTIACAVGHGPAAGIPVPQDMIAGFGGVHWHRYTELFVGQADDAGDPSDILDSWLFSGDWKDVDNHHWGAAARIRYVLETGEVPTDFVEELYGEPKPRHRRLYSPYRVSKRMPLKEAA